MKKLLRHIGVVLAVLAGCWGSPLQAQIKVTAQSDAMLNQHWAMPTLLNPAATGDIDFIRIRGGARLDYFGSRYSPKDFLATADSPFKLLGKRIGAGVVVNSMSYDLYRNLLVSAQGSYKLKIKNSNLSVGLQIGYFHTKFKGSEMTIYNNGSNTGSDTEGEEGETPAEDPDDETDRSEYPTQDVGAGALDLALGVRYDHPLFHVGVSVAHLTNPKMKLSKEGDEATDRYFLESHLPMTLYFEAGGNIKIKNSLFTLQPSILAASDFKDFTGIAEMRATYNQRVTFGLNYRYNRAAGVLAGLFVKDFYIGYSWEYDYKAHPRGSTGNHELVLGYQFKMKMDGKSNFRQRAIRLM
ncbi:MAG: PorP/SprF family type IX secretion system membrane protein [Muribaculaceae bacterium]|nr:PorP/SprF family type IX secretion system membrane protein [Muribaculaceae bacterium]